MSKSSEHNIGLQVVQNLVVSEVRELWKVEDWLLFDLLVIFVVVNLHEALSDEIHLLDVTLVADDSLSWCVDSAVHGNDELISEASLTFFKEMIERPFELLEDSCVLNQVGLHLWSNLLVELELLDNQVEIIQEGLLDVLSDVIIQSWLNMEWLVRLFNLLDPHV